MVARDGVEPPTPAFSGLRSTTCATWPLSWDTPASRSLRRDRRKMLRGPGTLQCGKNATSIPREVAIIIATRFETLNSSAPGTRRPWALRAHRSQVSDTHAGVTCGSVFGRGCPAFCNATQHNPQCVAPAIYFPVAATTSPLVNPPPTLSRSLQWLRTKSHASAEPAGLSITAETRPRVSWLRTAGEIAKSKVRCNRRGSRNLEIVWKYR